MQNAQAMYTMFVVATGDGWSADFTLPCAVGAPEAWVFFIVYQLLASFVLINVVVGFLLEKMVCIGRWLSTNGHRPSSASALHADQRHGCLGSG